MFDPFAHLDVRWQQAMAGRWEACSQPERRPDGLAHFVKGCDGCRIALQVATSVEPPAGEFDGWWRFRSDPEVVAMLAR